MILRRCAEMRFEDGKPHPDQRIHDMQKEAYKALLPNDERLLHIVLHDSFGEPLPLNFTAAEIEVLRKQILRDPFPRIKLECETTKLQIRYVDSLLWKRLLATAESNVDEPGRAEQQSNTFTPNLSHQDLRWYLLAQISAWFSVAIPCAFAAAISYTTPKVGYLMHSPLVKNSLITFILRSPYLVGP